MEHFTFYRKAIFIFVIFILAACTRAASKAPDTISNSQQEQYRVALPLVIGVNVPPPAGQEQPEIEGEWLSLHSAELGISFEFPPLPGQVSYSVNRWVATETSPGGALISWEVTRSDQTWTYSFAGCATEYFQGGRERWVTDMVHWTLDNSSSRYTITLGGETPDEVRVTPLEVYTRSDGLDALVFTMDPAFNPLPGRAAVINLPNRGEDNVQCISFYFADKMNLETIEQVIDSVQFDW